ncbi:pyruvate decarboxylase [Pseudohyphozyma bogoriensis]|nr:pyruvate decarboxylase [Pseudohyphozyma bogoriensis]
MADHDRSSLKDGEIFLSEYLLARLKELGVRTVFGVPGDFNLTFLDVLEDMDGIDFCGNTNELNGSYAADGYSRVKQAQLSAGGKSGGKTTQGGVKGLGAIITTFGVGELSAMNGIAGAYSERVPVIHIVGVPGTKLQSNGALLHHTLGDGSFNVFHESAKGVTAAQAFLKSTKGATEEIDRVLRVALDTARPTYLTLPTDLVFAGVSSEPLKSPIVPKTALIAHPEQLPSGEEIDKELHGVVKFVTDEVERLWEKAENPILLIDACAIRYGVTHLVKELVDQTKVKYFTTPMGKGSLPEEASNGFGGVYVGEISDPDVKKAVEAADLTILVGSLKSDFNTGEFSYKMPKEEMIELHSDHTVVQYAHYPEVSFHTLLPALTKVLKPKKVQATPEHAGQVKEVPAGDADKVVTHAAFWPLWGKFLQENDIVIAETGTSSFGIIDVPLPKGVTAVSQVLWGSIGWAGGALLGCLKAAQEAEYSRRTILFIGDGSLQLTVQEISTMLRHGLKPIIVVLNNDGYTIERLINGPERGYNDISHWNWQQTLEFFNADKVPHKTWLANTRGELEVILNDRSFAAADKCQLIEVKMDRLDAPTCLVRQAKLSADLNAAI